MSCSSFSLLFSKLLAIELNFKHDGFLKKLLVAITCLLLLLLLLRCCCFYYNYYLISSDQMLRLIKKSIPSKCFSNDLALFLKIIDFVCHSMSLNCSRNSRPLQ